jgi:hypothetical protein
MSSCSNDVVKKCVRCVFVHAKKLMFRNCGANFVENIKLKIKI